MAKSRKALLVIDVQNGLFNVAHHNVVHESKMISNINSLVKKAHKAQAPVYFIQHHNDSFLKRPTKGWQLHPDLKVGASDMHLHKHHSSSFQETELDDELKKKGIDHIVVTGLVTHGCVRAACLDGLKLGYEVHLAADGHSNFSRNAINVIKAWNNRLEMRGIQVAPTASIEF